MSNKAVIILSGGMDSVTTLALAKDRGYDCYTLSFNYGQKSISELDAALYYSKKYHCIKHKNKSLHSKGFRYWFFHPSCFDKVYFNRQRSPICSLWSMKIYRLYPECKISHY